MSEKIFKGIALALVVVYILILILLVVQLFFPATSTLVH
jgi:hypothetical protein